jgi:Ca2+-binding RTX toxin-like protein
MGGGLRRGGLAASGGPGVDVIDAAPGADVDALYFDATRGVRVSTDGHANDGMPGERDDVGRRVRTISAGARDDVLDARRARGPVTMYGWAGNDRLYASPGGGGLQGGPGDDVLRGGPGRDRLGGEDGDDRLFGGGGDDVLSGDAGRNVATGGSAHDSYFISSDARDVIHAGDSDRDRVDCTMLPRLLEVDPGDRLTGCAFPVAVVDTPRLDRRRRLHLVFACPRLAPGGCRVTVRLIDTSPHPLADARFSIAAGRRVSRAIHLDHAPRNGLLTAILVNHRARPPASRRTTVASFQLGADCPAGHDGEAACPPPSPVPRSSTPPP